MEVARGKGILHIVSTLVDIIGGIGLTLMVLCVLFQVFVRYFVNLLGTVSFAWTEEMARFLLIFITFWGGAIALRKREHITIPFLLERVSPRTRLWLHLLFILAMGLFLVIVIAGSITMMRVTWNTPVGSGIRWLTVGRVYIFVPLGCGLMALYLGLWAIEVITQLKKPEWNTQKPKEK